MNNNTCDKNRSPILASVIIHTILWLVIIVAIGMPVFQSHYIYPAFIRQLIENTENEAIRTGNHLERTVLKRYSGVPVHISDEIKADLDNIREDYNLWKIKIFSNSGKVIYSSEEDIGEINKKSYFHDIVAKGNVYTKVVVKNTKSLEDQIITSDVVETYIPIMRQGDFIGAFEIYYNITVRKDSMDDLISRSNSLIYMLTFIIIIVVLGTMVGFRKSMQKRQQFEEALFEMANTDKLTGTYSRRRFEELLQLEIERFNRYQNNACILLFDIDHFKNVNDTYGHQAGDDVFVALTQICTDTLRKSDILGRYGGDEFIAFLPETDRKKAFRVAERLRRAVDSASIPSSGSTIRVTISIGIAHFKDIDALSIDRVIKQADDSLYSAKNRGRNQVVCIRKSGERQESEKGDRFTPFPEAS